MAQGPMDHDRISNLEKALDERKELTREQFREILRRMDAEQAKRDAEAMELRKLIDSRWESALTRSDEQQARSDALHAETRRRHDELAARMDRKFDRQTALIMTSWLSTIGTMLYLHFN